MKSFFLFGLTLFAFTLTAQPLIQLVEHTGDFGPNIPGIWGVAGRPLTAQFATRSEPEAAVPERIRAGAPWRIIDGKRIHRLISIPISLVNLGSEPFVFPNAFVDPDRYVLIGPWPAPRNWWQVTLSRGGQVWHVFPMSSVFWSNGASALPGMERPPSPIWWPRLDPGWAMIDGTDTSGAVIDVSDVVDGYGPGRWTMTITLWNGEETSREVEIKDLSCRLWDPRLPAWE